MVVTTIAQEITQAAKVFCVTSYSPRFANIWVCQYLIVFRKCKANTLLDHHHPERRRYGRSYSCDQLLRSSLSSNARTQAVGEAH